MAGFLLQLLADGLVTGIGIGLVAISFTLYYATTGTFHVAHAGLYTLGAYMAWWLTTMSVPFALACIAAAAICLLAGLLVQVLVYDRLDRTDASPLAKLIASLGVLYVLQNLVAILFSPDLLQFPTAWRGGVIQLGEVYLSYAQLVVAGSGLVIFAALMAFTRLTMAGTRIRAVASNPFLAEITQLRPHRVYLMVMAIASAIVAVAGAAIGFDQAIQPYTGILVLLVATIAVIAGGIGSITGAFVISIFLSVLQNATLVVLPGRWSIALTFALFIAFIVIRPRGLFAHR